MKIWLDAKFEAPDGYVWVKTVREAIQAIAEEERYVQLTYQSDISPVELVSIPIDEADGVELTEWLEDTGRHYTVLRHINEMVNQSQTMIPVEVYRIESASWTLIIKA